MFKKKIYNQALSNYSQVNVIYTGGWSKNPAPTTSLVCFSINSCKIIMASKHFRHSESKVTNNKLYKELDIVLNCDLIQMEHGTATDVPDLNMPIFHNWADKIHACFKANKDKSVLVNCNNGRSRTGTVVALHLMKYHQLSANDAMTIVTSVLRFRGITKDSINVDTINLHGNYGDWLRSWEVTNNDQAQKPKVNYLTQKRSLNASEKTIELTPNDENSPNVLKKRKLNPPEGILSTKAHNNHSQQFFKEINLNLIVDKDTLTSQQLNLRYRK